MFIPAHCIGDFASSDVESVTSMGHGEISFFETPIWGARLVTFHGLQRAH
jgi:hypothetical protein